MYPSPYFIGQLGKFIFALSTAVAGGAGSDGSISGGRSRASSGVIAGTLSLESEGSKIKIMYLNATIMTHLGFLLSHQDDGRIIASKRVEKKSGRENFTIYQMGDKVAIQTCRGTFWTAHPDGNLTSNASVTKDWEKFHLEKAGTNQIWLRGHHGKIVTVKPSGQVAADGSTSGPTELLSPQDPYIWVPPPESPPRAGTLALPIPPPPPCGPE